MFAFGQWWLRAPNYPAGNASLLLTSCSAYPRASSGTGYFLRSRQERHDQCHRGSRMAHCCVLRLVSVSLKRRQFRSNDKDVIRVFGDASGGARQRSNRGLFATCRTSVAVSACAGYLSIHSLTDFGTRACSLCPVARIGIILARLAQHGLRAKLLV